MASHPPSRMTKIKANAFDRHCSFTFQFLNRYVWGRGGGGGGGGGGGVGACPIDSATPRYQLQAPSSKNTGSGLWIAPVGNKV